MDFDEKLSGLDWKKRIRANSLILNDKEHLTILVALLESYLECNYSKEIKASLDSRKHVGADVQFTSIIRIDLNELAKFDPEIADLVELYPVEMNECFRTAIELVSEKLYFEKVKPPFMMTKFYDGLTAKIPDLKSTTEGVVIKIKGVIRAATPPFSIASAETVQCLSCGNVQEYTHGLFSREKVKTCSACGKTTLKSVDVSKEDKIYLEVEEDVSGLDRSPMSLQMYLQGNLCVEEITKNVLQVGRRVEVVGVVRERELSLKGDKTKRYEKFLDVFSIEFVDDLGELNATPEDIKAFEKFSKTDNPLKQIGEQIAPYLVSPHWTKIKPALSAYLFGGIHHDAKGSKGSIRGAINILLVGDPSCGKSQASKSTLSFSPRGKYAVGGKQSTGIGLTAAVVEVDGKPTLRAGALPLADDGHCGIDEFRDIPKEDMEIFKEAMEDQQITIHKWGISASLRTRVGVLATQNPDGDRFNPYKPLREQIDIPDALRSRFDITILIRDTLDETTDNSIFASIFKRRRQGNATTNAKELDHTFVRKYIAYARKKITKVTIPAEIESKIIAWAISIRRLDVSEGENAIPQFLPRNLEGVLRVVEASAKSRLSTVANEEDWQNAKEIFEYQMNTLGIDPNTGKFDINKMEGKEAMSEVKLKEAILKIIKQEYGTSPFDEKIAKDMLVAKGFEKAKIKTIFERLHKENKLKYPKVGEWQITSSA